MDWMTKQMLKFEATRKLAVKVNRELNKNPGRLPEPIYGITRITVDKQTMKEIMSDARQHDSNQQV